MKSSALDLHQPLPYHDLYSDLAYQILDAVTREPDYDLEKLFHSFAEYTWNQVFLEVDRMSRTGELRLFLRGPGQYTVCLPLQTAQQRSRSEERFLVNV